MVVTRSSTPFKESSSLSRSAAAGLTKEKPSRKTTKKVEQPTEDEKENVKLKEEENQEDQEQEQEDEEEFEIKTSKFFSNTPSSSTSSSSKSAAAKEEIPTFKTKFFSLLKLSRPNFLFYSAFLHYTGILLYRSQNRTLGKEDIEIDWVLSGLLQATISVTHIGTHFWNEWADYEVDCLNENASSWTGGSKVLKKGIFSPSLAYWLGIGSAFTSFWLGFFTCARYLLLRHDLQLMAALLDPMDTFYKLPLDFVWVGLSVLFVAIAYSVEPVRLSARGLGEVCVSYVLTFATPAVGYALQGGVLDEVFFSNLLPLFIINAARMIVMNIPDREGDRLGNKKTSVVIVGEERAQMLNNLLYAITFLYIVPNLPLLSWHVRMSYLALIPLRWWLSLHLNEPQWWTKPGPVDNLPFYESMFVIATVIALNVGLSLSLACVLNSYSLKLPRYFSIHFQRSLKFTPDLSM